MNKYLRLILVTGSVLLGFSCGAPNPSSPVPSGDLLSALSTGDHRVLDSLDPSQGALEEMRRTRPDGPYILGRALERRGRDAAAELVYQAELIAGVSPWDGFSAVRLSGISERRGNRLAAQGHAQSAVELLPAFRDGWMALGTALYRRDDYPALLEMVNQLPSEEELSAGERVSATELYREAALWRAVGAWETGAQPESAFRDVFIAESVGAIHERLFLYLFYRNNGSATFSPVVRLLMEAVYRQERGEPREALRLMTMVEPEALIREALAVAREDRAPGRPITVAELGIWDTVIAMVRDHGDRATDSWLQRVHTVVSERSGEEELHNLPSMVKLIQAEAAASRRADAEEVADLLIQAGENAHGAELRRRIAARLVAFGVDRGHPLKRVIDDVHRLERATGLDSFPEAYATAADRLLPPMVQDRAWEEISSLLKRIPPDAGSARTRMLVILVHAADAGLIPGDGEQHEAWEEELAAAVENLSAIGYSGMVGRLRYGMPAVSRESSDAGDDAGQEDTNEPVLAESALERELDVVHGEALVLAGDARPALAITMRAARSAERAPEMVEIASLMAELGHTSDALDVARRAVSRAERALTPEIIELIYPIPFRTELQAAADRYDVPVYLLTALVREESHFRPIALSPVGAQGLGQIMPATADDIRRRMDWPEADVSRPADNLLMSAYYLDYLAGEIESPVLRLAAYNAGLGRGRRWQRAFGDLPPILQIEALPFVETRWYLRRIIVSQAVYRERMLGADLELGMREFMEGAIW